MFHNVRMVSEITCGCYCFRSDAARGVRRRVSPAAARAPAGATSAAQVNISFTTTRSYITVKFHDDLSWVLLKYLTVVRQQ